MERQEPTFTIAWEAQQPAPIHLTGWLALAKATKLSIGTLQNRLSVNGGRWARDYRTNPATGNPDTQVITKHRRGTAGRPGQWAYRLAREGQPVLMYTSVAAAAEALGLRASTLKQYLSCSGGKLVRSGYTLTRVPKPNRVGEPGPHKHANRLRQD